MTSTLYIEFDRVPASKFYPGLNFGDAGGIDNEHWVRVTSTSFFAGGWISIDTRAVGVDRVTSIARRRVDGDGIVGMPVGRLPILEDLATGCWVIVALLGIADGGRRFTADEASIDCFVQLRPGFILRPAFVIGKLLLSSAHLSFELRKRTSYTFAGVGVDQSKGGVEKSR